MGKKANNAPRGPTSAFQFSQCQSPIDLLPFLLGALSRGIHTMPSTLHVFPIGRVCDVKWHQATVQEFSLSPTTCSIHIGTQTDSKVRNSDVKEHRCGAVAPRVSALQRANRCPVGRSVS